MKTFNEIKEDLLKEYKRQIESWSKDELATKEYREGTIADINRAINNIDEMTRVHIASTAQLTVNGIHSTTENLENFLAHFSPLEIVGEDKELIDLASNYKYAKTQKNRSAFIQAVFNKIGIGNMVPTIEKLNELDTELKNIG